jgi:hypothetical protein
MPLALSLSPSQSMVNDTTTRISKAQAHRLRPEGSGAPAPTLNAPFDAVISPLKVFIVFMALLENRFRLSLRKVTLQNVSHVCPPSGQRQARWAAAGPWLAPSPIDSQVVAPDDPMHRPLPASRPAP